MGIFNPVSTSASIESLASFCDCLKDIILEPVPVKDAGGGYAICFADFFPFCGNSQCEI